MKLPKIKKLPSGSYHCEVRSGDKRISVTEETEAECLSKAMLIISGRLTGSKETEKARQNLTLREAMDLYIKQRSNVLSPSTLYGYGQIKKHRFKQVMDLKASSISDWQMVVNMEAELVSAKTLKNAWGFTKSVLENIKINPGDVALPQVVIKEAAFYEPDEIESFIDAIRDERYELSYLLCLHSLRASEVLAIDVKDNIKDGFIIVSGAVVINSDSKLVKKETNKTQASHRRIPILTERITEILEQLGDEAQKQIPKTDSSLTRGLKRICKEKKLKYVSPHGLRHSFASLCYHLNVNEATTMKLGGWSDPTVMRKIYTHLAALDKAAAEQSLKDFFSKKKKDEEEVPKIEKKAV